MKNIFSIELERELKITEKKNTKAALAEVSCSCTCQNKMIFGLPNFRHQHVNI